MALLTDRIQKNDLGKGVRMYVSGDTIHDFLACWYFELMFGRVCSKPWPMSKL